MLKLVQHLYRSNPYLLFLKRSLSKENEIPATKISKSGTITTAIKLYLDKCLEKDKLMACERREFEFGRKYLAKMMGADPETFTQNDIDESIRYLFPSGLFSDAAKPIMTDPVNIYPIKKTLESDESGRPYNTLFYTAKPSFYTIMMEAVILLEKLKSLEDAAYRNQPVKGGPVQLYNAKWLDKQQLANYCNEKVHVLQYSSWLTLMETINNHPYASEAEEFLLKMRIPLKEFEIAKDIPKPSIDPETQRTFAESYGQKKWSMVEVKLFMPGQGQFSLNGKRLLEAVPLISNREAILFPLQFTDTIGKVDIVAHAKESGPSSVALAMRLAISRALSCFLSQEEVSRMRIAGLLTQDDRYRERKKPGQRKARKKPIWRKR